jgi:predicted amidophosphoribosyltransferase
MGGIVECFLDALFPRTCVSCQQKGQLLCVFCAANNPLGEVPPFTEQHAACTWYATPAVRRLIDAWKFHGDLQAEQYFRTRVQACATATA